jgi:hypothetical protein
MTTAREASAAAREERVRRGVVSSDASLNNDRDDLTK